MELDEAFAHLGNFSGRYQKLLYAALCWGYVVAPFVLVGMVFIGGAPRTYYCKPSVPGFGGPDVDMCHAYKVQNDTITDELIYCQHGWSYEADIGERTFVMDFSLVCDDAIFGKVALSIFMAGVMVGAITSGHISDYYGRRIVLHVSYLGEAICGVLMILVGDYYAFLVFYFLFGMFQQGVLNSSVVMIAEMFSPESRTLAASGTSMVWGGFVAMVAPVSYIFRNWKHYQWFISALHLVGASMWWVVPESTRWLISRGRIEQAEANLHKIARFNGIKAPTNFLSENVVLQKANEEDAETKNKITNGGYVTINQKDPGDEGAMAVNVSNIDTLRDKTDVIVSKRRYNITHLIRSRILLRSFLILAFCWFTNSIYYYGLSLNSALIAGNKYLNVFLGCLVEFPSGLLMVLALKWFTNSIYYYGLSLNSALIAGNKYLNVFLGCLVEFPSGLLMVLALKWIGRRPMISVAFVIGGLCCFIIAFLPDKTDNGTNLVPLIITISTIGKFWASWSFSMMYVISPEIMPTVIRQVTMGGGSFCSRIGGILAPFVIHLANVHEYIPMNILGLFALTAAFMCLILPEPRGKALPNTIEEGEDFCRDIHIFPDCRNKKSNKHLHL